MTGIRELLDAAADTPQHDVDVDALQHRVRRRQRRTGVLAGALVVLALIAVSAVFAATDDPTTVRTPAVSPGPARDVIPDGWHRVESGGAGVSISIPSDWDEIPGGWADLLVGTGAQDLQRLPSLCSALDPPPDRAAWVAVNQMPPDQAQYATDAPADFSTLDGGTTTSCTLDVEAVGPRVETFLFVVAGKVLHAQVTVVGDPNGDGFRLARQILNTLRVGPVGTSAESDVVAGDENAVRTAVERWYAASDDAERAALVEDYDAVKPALDATLAVNDRLRPGGRVGPLVAQIDSVSLVDADHALVTYSLVASESGSVFLRPEPGVVVRKGGRWLLSNEMACAPLGVGGVACPAR